MADVKKHTDLAGVSNTKTTSTQTSKSVKFDSSSKSDSARSKSRKKIDKIPEVSILTDFIMLTLFSCAVIFALNSLYSIGGIPDIILFLGLLIFVGVCVKLNKEWNDQSWQLTIHVSMTLLEIYVLWDEEWYTNPTSVWKTGGCLAEKTKFSLKFFYIIQLAIWIWTGFSCRFLEERRHDYVIMMTHHVMTIFLVAASWAGKSAMIGIVVLHIHDASDIFVDLVKMVNYLKLEDAAGFFLSEIVYVLCLIMWVYFRLYIFPFKILRSSLFDAHLYCNEGLSYAGKISYLFPALPHYWFPANIFLGVLQAFHIWWFFLLARIGWRLTIGESGNKIAASEYEGGSASESEKEKHE